LFRFIFIDLQNVGVISAAPCILLSVRFREILWWGGTYLLLVCLLL